MEDTVHNIPKRPLRILTIDNGGLQAVSLLTILKNICNAKADAEGLKTECAPWEIFDIIAGIGTGGWLAIMLGRYKMTVSECIGLYMMIVRDIEPDRKQPDDERYGKSVALNQNWLIERIETYISLFQHGSHLVDEPEPNDSEPTTRKCYSFAAGPIWKNSSSDPQEYHLFRCYPPAPQSTLKGPDPSTLKVSDACAATAAAKHFMQACEIDGTRYWDDSFPLPTHNISEIALREAESLFGADVPISFLLNLSPGIPTKAHLKSLRKAAKRNSTTSERIMSKLGSMLSALSVPEANTYKRLDPRSRRNRWPPEQLTGLLRSESSLSSCSTTSTSQKDSKQQENIQEVLEKSHRGMDIYMRLQVDPTAKIPYLNDREEFGEAIEAGRTCSKENEPIMKKIIAICTDKTDELNVLATGIAGTELQNVSPQDMSCNKLEAMV